MPGLPILILAAAAWAAAPERAWNDTLSPHFHVFHEKSFMPGGFTMGLEKIHGKLRFDLAMFSPWMGKERLKLYLYRNQNAYINGEFKPPAWSNGVSMYELRTVAVFDQPDRAKLMDVISHETTHLLFESYFGEVGREPPSWLNEGMAMVQEADPKHPEKSDWFRAMVYLPEKGFLKLDDLMALSPTKDLKDDKAKVEVWYVQSYSLVYFLLRKHSRLQFKSFCSRLRDGESAEKALWMSYRYKSLKKLEAAWLAWLRDPALLRKAEEGRPAQQPASAGVQGAPTRPTRLGHIEGFKPLEAK